MTKFRSISLLTMAVLAAAPRLAHGQIESFDNYSIPAAPPIEWGALIVQMTVPAEKQIIWHSFAVPTLAPHSYQGIIPVSELPVAWVAQPNEHLYHVFALDGKPEDGIRDGDRVLIGEWAQLQAAYICERVIESNSEHELHEQPYDPTRCHLRVETVQPRARIEIGRKTDDGTRFRLAVTSRRDASNEPLPDLYLATSSGRLTLQQAREGAAEFTFTQFEAIPTTPWRSWDSGEVVIVTDDNQWVLQTRWQSWENDASEPPTHRTAVQRAPQWPGGLGLVAQFIADNRFELHGFTRGNPPAIDPKGPAFIRGTSWGDFEQLCGGYEHARADQVDRFPSDGCYWFIEPVGGDRVQLGTVTGGGGTPVRIGFSNNTNGDGGLRYLSVHANSGGQDWRAAGLAGDATTFRILRNDSGN